MFKLLACAKRSMLATKFYSSLSLLEYPLPSGIDLVLVLELVLGFLRLEETASSSPFAGTAVRGVKLKQQ
jgi:hypothetical protein